MPPGNPLNIDRFLLESCETASIKVMEELQIETEYLGQIFKSLFEANSSLITQRKYKYSKPVPKSPLILSMNGNQLSDLHNRVSSISDAMDARCFKLLFSKMS